VGLPVLKVPAHRLLAAPEVPVATEVPVVVVAADAAAPEVEAVAVAVAVATAAAVAAAAAADDASSGGARLTSSASTRSTISTTKMLTAYASSSEIAARSCRAVTPVSAPSISGFSSALSSAPATLRCSRSPAQANRPVVDVRCDPAMTAVTDRAQGQHPLQDRPRQISRPPAKK